MPLGAAERFPYRITKILFLQDDILLLTSDGLPEVFNGSGEIYGYDKPEVLLQQFAHLQPAEMIPDIVNEMIKFSGDEALRDDVSAIAIKKK